jgi:peroxiredoxin
VVDDDHFSGWRVSVGKLLSSVKSVAASRALWQSKHISIVFLGLIALIFAACTGAPPATAPLSNSSAPIDVATDFQLTLFGTENHQKGEVLRMSDLRGHPVVVNFWFPSCAPCVAEMPDLEKVFQNHKDEGVKFVGVQLVGIDTAEDGQNFVNDIGVTYALGTDPNGDIIKDYEIIGFPTTVFIDKDQKIVRKWTGPLTEEKIEELVQEIL